MNPAAGRDIRRLTGGASVSSNYAKRRAAICVLEGLTAVAEPIRVSVMPDGAGVSASVFEHAPEGLTVRELDQPVTGSATDTRRAAERLREVADVVVVLGGDGTNRDVASEVGDVPVASVSTGTNNVVPTPIDGTPAGAAAALVATDAIPADEVTLRHGMVEARVEGRAGDETVRGLASVGLSRRSFVGTRATLDPSELLGGVVSRAGPGEIGLSGVAGALASHPADAPGGVGLRLGPTTETPRTARAIVVPGVVARLGVAECRYLDDEAEMTFEVEEGVVTVDGERELEVQDATVRLRPVADGPRLVAFDRVFEAVARERCFQG